MMNKKDAIDSFKRRLTKKHCNEFDNNQLLVPGRIFMFENWTGVHEAEIMLYDKENLTVQFRNLFYNIEEKWTLNNLFIFDEEYLKTICAQAEDYGLLTDDKWKNENYIMDAGVYILHNDNKPIDRGYYIGQAKGKSGGLSGRLCDHVKNEDSKIDKAIKENEPFSLKVIKLANTDYEEINALEVALIAYYKSWYKWNKDGYNANRGPNCAGERAITKELL